MTSRRKPIVLELARNIAVLLGLALVVGLFIVDDQLAYALGLFLGGAVDIARLFMIQNALNKAMYRTPQGATNYIRAQYTLRFILTGIILYIAVITPFISFIGVCVGLLVLKPAAYIQGKLEPPVPKDGSVEFLEWEEEDEDEKSDFW